MNKNYCPKPCSVTGVCIGDTIKTGFTTGKVSFIYDDGYFDLVKLGEQNDILLTTITKDAVTHKLKHARLRLESKFNNDTLDCVEFRKSFLDNGRIDVLANAIERLFNSEHTQLYKDIEISVSILPEEWVEIIHK